MVNGFPRLQVLNISVEIYLIPSMFVAPGWKQRQDLYEIIYPTANDLNRLSRFKAGLDLCNSVPNTVRSQMHALKSTLSRVLCSAHV